MRRVDRRQVAIPNAGQAGLVFGQPPGLLAGFGQDQPGFHGVRRVGLGEHDQKLGLRLPGDIGPHPRELTQHLLAGVEIAPVADQSD
ncbi:hypothetical protein A5772_04830 [Mycolicibacter sinensis]|nr:hypothetical protein A5772_04830 [Mycolicibacter sinensis]